MRRQIKEYRALNAELRRDIRELNRYKKELNRNKEELKREKQALVSMPESKGMCRQEINRSLEQRKLVFRPGDRNAISG